MKTGTPGAVGSAGPSPSRAAADFATLLGEIRRLSPERLKDIERTIKNFHVAREEATKLLQQADRPERGLSR